MRAYVDELEYHPKEQQLLTEGYTHVVVLLDDIHNDVLDLVGFKNEFAARIYADAINIGHSINLKGEHHA